MEQIYELIENELKRAKEKHGDHFNSRHEAFAVMLEEIQEAEDNLENITAHNRILWFDIKKDVENIHSIEKIKSESIKCIEELIQVAAMCDKFCEFLKREGEKNER